MIITRYARLCLPLFSFSAAIQALTLAHASDDLPNPFPREQLVGQQLHRWDFDGGTEGWKALCDCAIEAKGGFLSIRSTGGDPYLSSGVGVPGNDFVVRIRMKLKSDGPGEFFWTSSTHPGTNAQRRVGFKLIHDGQWHEYQAAMHVEGNLTGLRLDPGTAPGQIEVDWIAIHQGGLHPLEIAGVKQTEAAVCMLLRNHRGQPIEAVVNDSPQTIASGDTTIDLPLAGDGALEAVRIDVRSQGLLDLVRNVWSYRPSAPINSVTRTLSDLTVETARDGSVVRIERKGTVVASLAPLVHIDHRQPTLTLKNDRWPLSFIGDGITVVLDVASDGTLRIEIDSQRPVEGPVLRVSGPLEQGLFAGLEYLGKGEHSSSKLDIETAEHLRFAPDPMKVTMPLMAVVTGKASVAMSWDDMTLRPVFAAPDFIDGAAGHRMALKGSKIRATVRVGSGWNEGGRLEEAILWVVNCRGLPELPNPPRSFDEQMELSLAAYRGLVHNPENGGWFHAVVPGSRRMPNNGAYLADCASSIWRITNRVPDVPSLQLGGAHVSNPASYFVTGRAAEWLRIADRGAEHLRRVQRSDGSYRYDGKYRRGHFENTASGICARPAYQLLEHARYTGNRQSLDAALKTLAFMKRFRTPRGAQTWEVSLHTPDILASAHLVWAYVRAYEITSDREHLVEARRWAITGLPFVYQWSNRPVMMYATTPVYGATHYRAPNWIGLPVQWCGTVYAYALLLLADHDQTLDWRKVAEGVTISGEQMQYPDGPSIGCLPDVFALPVQQRRPADINPGALVSLRLRLSGKLDSLDMATDGKHRIIAPFPVKAENGKAVIQGKPGVEYQVIIDGSRIVDITSRGEDVIDLKD